MRTCISVALAALSLLLPIATAGAAYRRLNLRLATTGGQDPTPSSRARFRERRRAASSN